MEVLKLNHNEFWRVYEANMNSAHQKEYARKRRMRISVPTVYELLLLVERPLMSFPLTYIGEDKNGEIDPLS